MRLAFFFAAFALLLSRVDADEGLGVRVNRAIDRGAAWLVKRQDADGSWNKDDKVHPLGRTALCTYTLLHAGYGRDHPAVEKALNFLRLSRFAPRSTYEAGCLLLLLHALGPAHDKTIHGICKWLVGHFRQGVRLWGYPDGTADLSNTQFAVFGLRIGQLHGFTVPPDLWRGLIDGVLRLQHASGAFRYRGPNTLYRASMTHAALIVLRFSVDGLKRKPPPEVRKAMARAHKWYEENYRVDRMPWGRGHHHGHYYYYMYGLSRYAQIFGLKRIGGHDWYRQGAEELLARQGENGAWKNLETTCFAILFLRKVVFTRPTKRAREAGDGAKPAKPPERPRPAKGVPCLRSWLIAGPFSSSKGEDGMLYEKHFRVARAAPAAGRSAGKQKWKLYESREDKVDLIAACGGRDFAAFYAATYLHAENAGEAVLWLGSDDGVKVFLNGVEVLEGHHHDYSGDDYYRVPLALAAGRNTLVLLVENTTYYCHFKARVAGLTGVTASTKRRLR